MSRWPLRQREQLFLHGGVLAFHFSVLFNVAVIRNKRSGSGKSLILNSGIRISPRFPLRHHEATPSSIQNPNRGPRRVPHAGDPDTADLSKLRWQKHSSLSPEKSGREGAKPVVR